MAQATAPSDTANSAETRERLLEAAVALFADKGFAAVSLRQITREAGVNLAAVNYHFGSKDSLIVEVLQQVMAPINERRLALLESAEAKYAPEPAPIEAVIEALFAPAMEKVGSEDLSSQHFLKLVGRCLSQEDTQPPETMMRVFRSMADRFRDAAIRALPDCEPSQVLWRLHFSVGAFLYALTKADQLAAFAGDEVDAFDPEETLRQLVTFAAAGMRGCEEGGDLAQKAPAGERGKAKRGRATGGRKAAIGLLAAAALGGIGCRGTSPPSAASALDVDIPSSYRDAENRDTPLPDHAWVARFKDKRLDELVDEALQENADLKIAAARVEIAAANASIEGAAIMPQLDATGNASRAKQSFIGFPGGGSGPSDAPGASDSVGSSLVNQFGFSLNVQWEVDLWGKLRAAESAAIAVLEAEEEQRSGAELSIAAQTAKAWFALIEARQQEALARNTLETFSQTEKLIEDRFRLGVADDGQANRASQLRLAKSDVAVARENVVARTEQVELASRQLEVLLGRYPRAALESGVSLPGLPKAPPAGIPADLLERRPDLVAAERRLASADQRLIEAKRAMLPALRLTGSAGTLSEQIEDFLDSDFSVWSLAGNLTQPILTGGVLRAGVRLRRSEITEAAADYERVVLIAFREVEDSLAAEGYLARREANLSDADQLAAEAYEQAQQEYVNGVGDILTLLETQRRKFQTETELLSVRRSRLDNRVDLHLALGGDYRARGTTTKPAASKPVES